MSDEPKVPGAGEEGKEEQSRMTGAARRASRFSREFLATVISLMTTAFGVVAALAWNEALSKALERMSRRAELIGLFIYAVGVTGLAVLIIVFLGRLAGRIGAEPIEFKYPAKPIKE